MKAAVGDHLVIRGHKIHEPQREAIVVEARGADGAPPYVVKWLDDGHEGLFFPGPDAMVEHHAQTAAVNDDAAR